MAFNWHSDPITPQTLITSSYRTTQNVRRFFARELGIEIHFSSGFMAWMKSSAGKTMTEALEQFRSVNGL